MMDGGFSWLELIAAVSALFAASAAWRSAKAAERAATKEPFVDVVEWYNIEVLGSDEPQKLVFSARLQELAGVPTILHRVRVKYNPGIADRATFRDIVPARGIAGGRLPRSTTLYGDRLTALLREELNVSVRHWQRAAPRSLPDSVGRINLELTISAQEAHLRVWEIEAWIIYYGLQDGVHRVEMNGVPPVFVGRSTVLAVPEVRQKQQERLSITGPL